MLWEKKAWEAVSKRKKSGKRLQGKKRNVAEVVETTFFSPPVPRTLNTPSVFNYSFDHTRQWKRPRKLIRISEDVNTFKKPQPLELDPTTDKPKKPVVVVLSPRPAVNSLKFNLKITNFNTPESGKQERTFSKKHKPNDNFSLSNSKTDDKHKPFCDFVDSDSDLSQLQDQYKLAQLKLKYLRLRKQLSTLPGYS